MGRSCCVPGCKSNYGVKTHTSIFKFPKDQVLRNKWVKCIHRENFEVSESSVVCINHFESRFVITEDIFPVENGNAIHVPRKVPKLTSDAYPTIFPNQPSYHTVNLPNPRKNPAERVQEQIERDENLFQEWCEKDVIENFDDFKKEIMNRDVSPFISIGKTNYILFLIVKDHCIEEVPSLSLSFKITTAMEVSMFYGNTTLPTDQFSWILGSDLKCDRWTKFDNLISHLSNYNNKSLNFNDIITILTNNIKDTLNTEDNANEEVAHKISFLVEQLELSITNQVRYSPELLIWSAKLCYSFPGAYQSLRDSKVMTLPHPEYLKQFLTKLGPISSGIGSSQKAFLKEKCKLLQDKDKIISVMLDEIYLNSKVTYKSGQVLGLAGNSSETEAASTMQAFMSSSLCSKNKDIIGLFPVKKINAEMLHTITIEVLKTLHDLGFHVVCLVSDNHTVNRKMFEIMCGGALKPCIPNPVSTENQLFLLFDSVHLLKCIRNNWLNKPNETFTVPNVEDTFSIIESASNTAETTTTVCEYTMIDARFSDLRDIFKSEKNKLVKLAPNLSSKALYPTSIERQNASLAINIFNIKSIIALQTVKEENRLCISDGTIQFLKLINKWWSIVNVKHPFKGKYSRNEAENPIYGIDDEKLTFLENFKTYIDIWHLSNTKGKLTKDTFIALTHTLTTVAHLCKYIFSKYNWSYILLGKLQTDNLEGRFGAYRRLSGCSYNVTVEQILESERKLKMLNVLKLKSDKYGEFKLSDFALNVERNRKEEIIENLDKLMPAIDEITCLDIDIETQKILVCLASYTSKKVVEKLHKRGKCIHCQIMLQSDEDIVLQYASEEVFTYFDQLNRGGLKLPSPFVISLCVSMYNLFQVLISKPYESEFLKLKNQRVALVTLGLQMSESDINLDNPCECGIQLRRVLKKCIKVLSNLFINNYTKVLNENNISREVSAKFKGNNEQYAGGVNLKVKRRKEQKFTTT